MDKRVLLAVAIVVLVLGVVLFVRLSQNTMTNLNTNQESGQNLQVSQKDTVQQRYDDDDEYEEDDDEDYEDDDDYAKNLASLSDIASSTSSGTTVSLSELATHNSASDCWIAFEGKVYDITDYIPRHPGGENKIIPNCGSKDQFETAFTNQHGRSKVSLLINIGVFIGDFDVVGNL